MNSLKKRLIALALLTCMAVTSFAGCSKDSGKKKSSDNDSSKSDDASTGDNSSTSGDANKDLDSIKNSPFEIVTDENGNPISIPLLSGEIGSAGESNLGGFSLNGEDPEKIDVSPSIPGDNSQTSTKAVEVTDAKGEKVTDNAGAPVTEYVTVTSPASSGDSDYKSKTSGNYVFWCGDISKNEDYVFNGQFLKVTFEIKEDIPDGVYPITFKTDFSTVNATSLKPAAVDGSISVGGQAKNVDNSSNGDFVIYGDNISCKQGDTVDYYIYLDNNPGLVATVVWFYYDSNAMTVKKKGVKAAGEFAEVSNGIQTNN